MLRHSSGTGATNASVVTLGQWEQGGKIVKLRVCWRYVVKKAVDSCTFHASQLERLREFIKLIRVEC